jgi:D-alanyl-D-alanine dipeptidase
VPILLFIGLVGVVVLIMSDAGKRTSIGNPVTDVPIVLTGYKAGAPFELSCLSIGDFGCYLEANAAKAWLAMQGDANLDGVTLIPEGPNSAFRTHEQQEAMISAYPQNAAELDHSPHQQGIAVDITGIPTGSTDSNSPVLAWLHANAGNYGWQPLSGNGALKEPWHWQYNGTFVPSDTQGVA